MVAQQQAELLQVVAGEQLGPGEGGLVVAGVRDEAVGQPRVRVAVVRRGQPHEGVAGAHARQGAGGRRFEGDEGLQLLAQVRQAGVVDLADARQRGVGVGEGGGRDEGRKQGHGLLSTPAKAWP